MSGRVLCCALTVNVPAAIDGGIEIGRDLPGEGGGTEAWNGRGGQESAQRHVSILGGSHII